MVFAAAVLKLNPIDGKLSTTQKMKMNNKSTTSVNDKFAQDIVLVSVSFLIIYNQAEKIMRNL